MAGVRGRSGRKPKLLKAFLEELLDEAWPRNKRLMVIKRLHDAVIDDGDIDAAKTLLAYAYGRPKSQVELSGPEGGPMEVDVSIVDAFKRRIANLARARGQG
jgi:hypothetical protein